MFYTLDSLKVEEVDFYGNRWDKFSDLTNPKILDEDTYQGSVKHPAYILRGKKVTPEQAFDIIATESAPRDYFGEMYQDTEEYKNEP